ARRPPTGPRGASRTHRPPPPAWSRYSSFVRRHTALATARRRAVPCLEHRVVRARDPWRFFAMPRIANQRPSPASVLRHILAVVLFLLAAGCSGGGCGGGCSSCGGIPPLPNGFDVNSRIENAGSARVTPSSLKFLQSNLGALAKGLLGGSSQNGIILFP